MKRRSCILREDGRRKRKGEEGGYILVIWGEPVRVEETSLVLQQSVQCNLISFPT